MSAKLLAPTLIVCLLTLLATAHNSYQVPPSGVPRYDTYNPAPVRHQEQTYGTPPPRTYSTPAPQPVQEPPHDYEPPVAVYQPPQTYNPPPQEQPKVYETPPPPCPNGGRRHPATGECLVNECETGQHDCDRVATCLDTIDSYTCACQSGYIDEGPADKPGRVCTPPSSSNNCASGRSGCSPDAVCADTYNGVSCKCKNGFVDLSENSRSKPGQVCKKLVDECADPKLNTCSSDADCRDTFDSYYCVCKSGFKDVDTSNPGRECAKIEVSPCLDSSKNDCHKQAICIDDATKKPDGYTCKCRDGFTDKSIDLTRPGRICEETARCNNNDCDPQAICVNVADGYVCTCPAGTHDVSPDFATKPGRKCERVVETPIPLVIVKDGENATPFSTKYSSLTNKPAVEVIDTFTKDLGATILETHYGPAYINTTVTKISSPKSVQPAVDDGIIVNSTVLTQASAGPVNACSLFDAIVEKIQANGGYVGNGQLKVGDDIQKLNPCPKSLCGNKICNAALGEVCINGECVTDYCIDNFCPANATCINKSDHAECVCKAGFVDIRNASASLRLTAGLKEDQYCLRAVDVDYCALGLHDCHEAAVCVPLRGGYTCKCNENYVDQNPDHPGRLCLANAAAVTLQPSTLPWWLMLLLALLFLLLTLCCCLWALSRLRWFRRRGIMDQTGSSYSDLVIPRPKVRSMDAESMGSGSSEFTIREEIERRVVTDVTRTELRTEETEEVANEHETYTHTQSVDNERFIR